MCVCRSFELIGAACVHVCVCVHVRWVGRLVRAGEWRNRCAPGGIAWPPPARGAQVSKKPSPVRLLSSFSHRP